MRFLGTGSAVPHTVLTNDMLSTMVETSDEWIQARTGIRERRIVRDETTLDLALQAAGNACEAAAAQETFSLQQINLIVCATVSNEDRCPSLACSLQRDLGLREDILAFDLNAACSGFIYALIVASTFMKEQSCALVIGSEVLSRLTDFEDRSTCILFGDGAGAAIVMPDDASAEKEEFFWVTEACGNDELLKITDTIYMDGQGVFKFAVETIVRSVRAVCRKAQIDTADLDALICHQANERIIKSAAKRLDIPLERFFMNLSKYGNTSAASIPLALDEAVRSGFVKKDSRIVMAGFGGGLTAGAICLRWR